MNTSMQQMPQMHIHKKEDLKLSFLGSLNILAMIIQVAALVYTLSNAFSYTVVVAFHLVTMLPSILYHLIPEIRSNALYMFIAKGASTLVMGTVVLTVILFVLEKDGWGKLAWLVAIVFFTGPAGLTSITLLLALNFGQQQQDYFENQFGQKYGYFMPGNQMQYVLVRQESPSQIDQI
jgi:hypothetical protein